MKALLLVDIQNDFVPGGALAVDRGDEIAPVVNKILDRFDLVVATQDWHPPDHGSFAANHEGKEPGEFTELDGLVQILWPVHCVNRTKGAEFIDSLDTGKIVKVIQKGTDSMIDSYSGFFDNAHRKATGLEDYLREKGVTDVYICGLATDYCVKFTVLDAAELGFNTFLIADACRGVNLEPADSEKAVEEMKAAGVRVIESREI